MQPSPRRQRVLLVEVLIAERSEVSCVRGLALSSIGCGPWDFGRRDRDRGRGVGFPQLVDRDVVAEAVAVFARPRYDLALLCRA